MQIKQNYAFKVFSFNFHKVGKKREWKLESQKKDAVFVFLQGQFNPIQNVNRTCTDINDREFITNYLSLGWILQLSHAKSLSESQFWRTSTSWVDWKWIYHNSYICWHSLYHFVSPDGSCGGSSPPPRPAAPSLSPSPASPVCPGVCRSLAPWESSWFSALPLGSPGCRSLVSLGLPERTWANFRSKNHKYRSIFQKHSAKKRPHEFQMWKSSFHICLQYFWSFWISSSIFLKTLCDLHDSKCAYMISQVSFPWYGKWNFAFSYYHLWSWCLQMSYEWVHDMICES